MDAKTNNQRGVLIASLSKIAARQLTQSQAQQFDGFIANAMHFYPDADYLARPIQDIFWNLWGLCQFSAEQIDVASTENRARVRVFNPDPELDGWLSGHTTIYINQRDMPFLVDSLRNVLNRRGLNIFTLQSNPVWVVRNAQGAVERTCADFAENAEREALITIEVDLHSESELSDLRRELLDVLDDVEVVVSDFDPMRQRVETLIEELQSNAPEVEQLKESLEFLRWIQNGYFTFTGCVEFDLKIDGDNLYLSEAADSRCGLLRKYSGDRREGWVEELSPGVRALYKSDELLTITKSSQRSRVHRDVYSDYVVVKRFDTDGQPCGEVRFMGLYTSQFYSYSPRRIPILRNKVNWVMENSGFKATSHDGKALMAILDFHPRDELFFLSRESLAETAIGIWQIYERRVIKAFVHPDPFDKFVSCIVYLPRESFSTQARMKIQHSIGDRLDAVESEFTTQFLPESVLVRIYLVYQVRNKQYLNVASSDLEDIVRQVTRDWCDEFAAIAIEQGAENRSTETQSATLARRFQRAFPGAYRELYSPLQALAHIELFDILEGTGDIAIQLQHQQAVENNHLQLKLFHRQTPLELSDMIPMLENLGFRVVMEHPFLIRPEGDGDVWMQEFQLSFSLDVNVDVEAVQGSFKEALSTVWKGDAENDSFNRLVIGARLDWRAVAMLRLYARYLKQLGISYSQEFIADTLCRYLDITRNLVALFKSYFDPRYAGETRSERVQGLVVKILAALDDVDNISEDNVIRSYLEVIQATLRTNFFQTIEDGSSKSYISVKLESGKISLAPKPRPEFEIFVYSPRVEGVHLRGGKVARGGLRWSDRLEDYRTEVLGLVKAQQVKNAVIVPTGAKGGFVAKQASMAAGRDAWLQEGIASYMLYIQALLDITDNIIEGKIVPPVDVVRRDSDDPYLVVAADKGTATFSDIANEISHANNFWLGDAFASGGGNGYDHKAMGITARGAWVAVQRHFREIGIDIQQQDFTVVGVGDMGGDVFGNGMLLSEHIQLVSAFNHLHIFVDPNPDAASTFVERQRLFDTPRSTWDDFDRGLMSEGSAIYSRDSKSLTITPQIKQRFAIEQDEMTPTELINAILKSPVDLIWNGGIGTYVKASSENNAEVGDRANDALRVDGRDLRCKVFGEGGNLGMTQRGRIEFCLKGGLCNTDFIDNAAGVDCSDHEVNIKILLNQLVLNGHLGVDERNQFLESMTDSVAELVLHNNYRQTQAISLAQHRSDLQHAEYQRFMAWLESSGKLDRELEFLPTDDQLSERINRHKPSWTRPELAVLVCYSKVMLKEALVAADLLSEPFLAASVERAFPPALVARYPDEVANHQLRQEIVATQLANDMVDRVGFSFFFRQMESTGASAGDVIRAYSIAMNILGLHKLWDNIENSDLPATVQLDLLHILIRLTRRTTRWLLRNRRHNLNCSQIVGQFTAPMDLLLQQLPELHEVEWIKLWSAEKANITGLGVDDLLASRLAASDSMFISLGVVDTALHLGKPVQQVAKLYFKLGELLSLDWFMAQIVALNPENRWQDLARESYVDDLEGQRRRLTANLMSDLVGDDLELLVEGWQQQQAPLIERWKFMIKDLRHGPTPDFAMISVALRELLDLVQASIDGRG
ncbi:NAD-glutamate dehydrogenase [SAR92 clade bacterium H455]|uniref:NAD-glutamate dehydrogenase n=1 Tax=SAR92 clade bacterium H455 TaxID=2974818 RepID=A0ABY5TRG2_9GAMM|nr:NAD-glutamate dehydrogenase [SAR92 clade bacterium H455]